MPFSDYKVALVTGASAGMGEAIVERLCQEGIEVHAVAAPVAVNIGNIEITPTLQVPGGLSTMRPGDRES